MNQSKEDARFLYLQSFILLLAILYVYVLPFDFSSVVI